MEAFKDTLPILCNGFNSEYVPILFYGGSRHKSILTLCSFCSLLDQASDNYFVKYQ